MISRIIIKDIATFKEKVEFTPKLINYIYGSNGCGKTTLSKIIANPIKYNGSIIEKDGNDNLEIVVYNKDFVDDLFYDASKLKGIFTLGKDSKEIQESINKSKEVIEKLSYDNQTLEKNILKEEEKNKKNEDKIKEECWKIKTKLYNLFPEALKGYGGSKDKFKSKCLETIVDKDKLQKYEDLENNYKLLYKDELSIENEIDVIDNSELNSIEKDFIFKEIIKGNDETTVSELINKLNNSDWVKQGLIYIEESENKCPFCQQILPKNIHQVLEYFNEEYEYKCNRLLKLQSTYKLISNDILNKVKNVNFDYLKDDTDMKLYYEKLENDIKNNEREIELKVNSPSRIINLGATEEIVSKINDKINNLNIKIKENNQKISNIKNERIKFGNELWNYIVNQLETAIGVFNAKHNDYNATIKPQEIKLNANKTRILQEKNIIRENEQKITGISESLIAINKILKSFAFEGFELTKGNTEGTYKIIRPDGTDVGKTLSEGEYRFISFLYYFHLINGSNESSGIIKDKILVIDDPISSLDSNSIFIVSTLVKKLISDCFENKNGIKQIFVLTHNVYFYKEVVYRGLRDNKKEKKEKYFVLSKRNEISSIKEYNKNPIETMYQSLWEELKDENINNKTCCNTMRRILEYYFNIIGSKSYEKAINEFEGNDKIICKSLISYINDSSHYINEGIDIILDDDMVQKYKKVFKEIFYKLGHGEHYNMMMNEK